MQEHVIKVPDLGEGITEVELVAWRVSPGETVAEDQILADVMTDKATVEIPSSVAGQVVALGGEVGQVMAVGSELIRIAVQGETTPASTHAPDPAQTLETRTQPAVASAAQPDAAPPANAVSAPDAVAVARTRPSMPEPAQRNAKAGPSAGRPIASPAVRRRAWEFGVDLQMVSASGVGGRIMQADLERHVAAHGTRALSPRHAAPREGEELVRVIGLRRRIAQKMQDSKRRIPHFTYVEEVDVTDLEALRAQLNARWGDTRARLTLLPLLLRAMALALPDYPQVNARFDDEAGVVTRYGAFHAGIATQTDAGLMVPVLRHAEANDLWTNAAEITRLAQMTRAGKATRDELSGSTITISSLGALGGIVSTPVINAPEVAIVGVNRIAERPVIRAGAVVARKIMNLSSSFDHRVVDGADAAEFVRALRGYLESPATLLVD